MNKMDVVGTIIESEYYNGIYKGFLETERLSGTKDTIPFECNFYIKAGQRLHFQGEVHSYSIGGHKKTTFWVTGIQNATGKDIDIVEICGVLVSKQNARKTPAGKIITDFVIAVNKDKKSQYPSMIAWGRLAHNVASLEIGTSLSVIGRFQSRAYRKKVIVPEGSDTDTFETHTAYEISVNTLEVIDDRT